MLVIALTHGRELTYGGRRWKRTDVICKAVSRALRHMKIMRR